MGCGRGNKRPSGLGLEKGFAIPLFDSNKEKGFAIPLRRSGLILLAMLLEEKKEGKKGEKKEEKRRKGLQTPSPYFAIFV